MFQVFVCLRVRDEYIVLYEECNLHNDGVLETVTSPRARCHSWCFFILLLVFRAGARSVYVFEVKRKKRRKSERLARAALQPSFAAL